jgi:predicted nucleic acid-binding protein
MSKTYVVDANALLDFVEDGFGAARVEQLIKSAGAGESSILVSVVNWGEVFYCLWQKTGEQSARSVIARLSRLPIELVAVDAPQSIHAGEIKVRHKIPYVDCLAASLAVARHAVLVTSDRDFQKLGRRIQVLWLPRP